MRALFIASAVAAVIPTLLLGYANGITALAVTLMLVSGTVLHVRNQVTR